MSDLLTELQTLLNDLWDSSNTGNRTPTVSIGGEVKRLDLSSTDHIILSEAGHTASDAASGGSIKRKVNTVLIDFRTVASRAQAILIRDEIERIIVASEINPFSGSPFYDIVDITDLRDYTDTDGTVSYWRFVLTARFERFAEAF